MSRARAVLCAVLGAVIVGATGCANLPDSSAPQAIGTIQRSMPTTSVEAPAPGREPDLLLRDFVKASTDPANRHLAARQFLTKETSARWDDAASATIVDKIDLILESRTADRAVYTIRANRVGQLEPGGLYQARRAPSRPSSAGSRSTASGASTTCRRASSWIARSS